MPNDDLPLDPDHLTELLGDRGIPATEFTVTTTTRVLTRLTFPGAATSRLAAAALLQAGYDVSRVAQMPGWTVSVLQPLPED